MPKDKYLSKHSRWAKRQGRLMAKGTVKKARERAAEPQSQPLDAETSRQLAELKAWKFRKEHART